MSNLFEIATKKKYRFPYKGIINIEDMWDLSVEELDSIYKALTRKAKKNKEESLLAKKSEGEQDIDNMIELVKYIVSVKQQEAADRILAAQKRERNQEIMGIIKDKENQKLKDASIEDLYKMLEEKKENP